MSGSSCSSRREGRETDQEDESEQEGCGPDGGQAEPHLLAD